MKKRIGLVTVLMVCGAVFSAMGGMKAWEYSAGDTKNTIQDAIDDLDERTGTNGTIIIGGNQIVNGSVSNVDLAVGTIAESKLVASGTDGLGVKRTAVQHLTAANFRVGSNSLSSIVIPDNAMVTFGMLDAQSSIDSTNALFEWNLCLQALDDLYITVTGHTAAGVKALIPVGTAATAVKTTAARTPWIQCGAGNATGTVGATVVLEYIVTQ